MGDALRRYWIPACLSSDLPIPDSDPVRIRRVGEDFVAFRDTNASSASWTRRAVTEVPLLPSAGRGVRHPMPLPRWKFATDGTILETPNMADSRYRRP